MKDLTASTIAVAALLGTAALAAPATDWTQWRGPDRTGVSSETGLLRQWPAAGPAQVWTAQNLGGGYGAVSVDFSPSRVRV